MAHGLRYQNEILRPLVQTDLEVFDADAVLQKDNTRPHQAHIVNDFIQHQGIMGPRSPDLDPAGHLQNVLGRRVSTNPPPPGNVVQLTLFLHQQWRTIP